MAAFSIIIPVYGRYGFLRRALDSVLAQTFRDWECWVVDDGSVPSVERVLPDDERVFYFRQRHGGVSKARNEGLLRATSEWVAFLDSDDCWAPTKLEEQWAFIRSHPEVKVVQTEEIWVYKGQQRTIPRHLRKLDGDLFEASLERCAITPSSVVVHRSVVGEVGAFDEKLPACEDYDYWLRLTTRYEVGLLRRPLTTRHQGHRDQLSFRYEAMDRFRLRSLRLLYRGLGDGTKRELVRHQIVRRARVLSKGAFKRGRLVRALWFAVFGLAYKIAVRP